MKTVPQVHLVLLGKGNVGSAWLDTLAEQKARFEGEAELHLVAIANSTRYLLADSGLSNDDIYNFDKLARGGTVGDLISHLADANLTNLVILDITASQAVADHYLEFAQRGWNVISANKLPVTKSAERHKLIVNAFNQHKAYWGINATVGAALPVQASLSELLQAGDNLQAISGVFSGSLSYLLQNYDGKQSFTKLVKEAQQAGVTEPDPRDDLSGADVQRKLLILARVAGRYLNLDDIQVEPLLPQTLMQGSIDEFWSNQEAIDEHMASAYEKAEADGKKLAYLARAGFYGKVVEGQVGLTALPSTNAVTQLTPSDNVFTLETDFYQHNPLIIRGPGAGVQVTAAAVNIDLNKFVTQIAIGATQSAL